MKNKFIYTFSALLLSCVIAFSGIGGSYIQARASSGVIDVLWNTDEPAWKNICQYIGLVGVWNGAIVEPTLLGEMLAVKYSAEFIDYMVSDGYTEEVAEDTVNGSGGVIKDGISQDDNGNVVISDEVSDLCHGYLEQFLTENCGYIEVSTITPDEIPLKYFDSSQLFQNVKKTIESLDIVWLQLYCYSGYDYITLGYAPENYWCSYRFSDFQLSSQVEPLYPDWSTDYGLAYVHNAFVGGDGTTVVDAFRDFHPNFENGYWTKEQCSVVNIGSDFPGYPTRIYSHTSSNNIFTAVVSSDGRPVKVWGAYDDFKSYTVYNQKYYTTNNWINYDVSIDNSVTLTQSEYNFYTDNSTTIYQTIQNNIDDSGNDLTEQDIRDIVDDTLEDLLKDSGNDSGDSSASAPNKETLSFYEKVLDYLDKILKQLKQIKWLNVADLVDDIIANLMEWKSEFDPVVETIATKFPFCIPWDTMLIFGLLADEPETPYFEFPFVFENFGINETIVIDLEQFSTLSKISRFLLTLTFLMMLTSLTRKISEWFHSSN